MTIKKLTPRQVRWAEFLFEFNFVISYQSDKKNDKTDMLTWKLNERPIENKNKWRQYCMHMLLPLNRIDLDAKLQPIEKSEEDYANQTDSNIDSDASDKTSLLPEQVIESNRVDELCSKIYLYFTNSKELDKLDAYLKSLRVENRLLIKGSQLWVADKGQLQLEVIKKIHDQPAVNHPGTEKILEIAQRHYYWPGIKEMIQQFICNCHVCKQVKAVQDTYYGLLQPLPVPEWA